LRVHGNGKTTLELQLKLKPSLTLPTVSIKMFSFVYVAAKTKTANTAYKGSPTQTPPLTIAMRDDLAWALHGKS